VDCQLIRTFEFHGGAESDAFGKMVFPDHLHKRILLVTWWGEDKDISHSSIRRGTSGGGGGGGGGGSTTHPEIVGIHSSGPTFPTMLCPKVWGFGILHIKNQMYLSLSNQFLIFCPGWRFLFN